MSYYFTALEKAVGDRLTGDTGTGGLCAASPLLAVHPVGSSAGIGVYNTVVAVAESGTVFPLIVFQLEAVSGNDAMRTRSRQVNLILDIWCDASSTSFGPLARGAAILERLEGDWHAQPAGTPPTYGIDRWKPDLSATGWTADIFEFSNLSAAHTEDQYHWRYGASCTVSRVAA